MIRNILWQVDGALFDTRPAITYAISDALNQMGYAIALNVIDDLTYQSLDYCLMTLSQRFRLNSDLLRRQFAKSYLKISPDRQIPFPGAVQVCEFILNHEGLNVAISHLEFDAVKGLLDTHELANYFQDTLSDGMLALEKYMLNPEETLLVSSYADATQRGLRTCLFGENMSRIKAEFSIARYDELLNYLTM